MTIAVPPACQLILGLIFTVNIFSRLSSKIIAAPGHLGRELMYFHMSSIKYVCITALRAVKSAIEKEKEFIKMLEDWKIKMNSTYENIEFINSTFIGYP